MVIKMFEVKLNLEEIILLRKLIFSEIQIGNANPEKFSSSVMDNLYGIMEGIISSLNRKAGA